MNGILNLQRGQLKKTMTEFVYQVRVGEGYGEMFLRHNDEWEFENFKDAMECLTNNLEFQKDYIRITRTPKLCEDECEELGIEYEVETIRVVSPQK